MSRMADPAKREAWRRRLAAFQRGDASVAEFCRRSGVSVASFYQWRRRLRIAVVPAIPNGRQSATRVRRDPSASGWREGTPGARFVPIEVTVGPSIEVHLPNGARVVVPCHQRKAIRTVIASVANIGQEDRTC